MYFWCRSWIALILLSAIAALLWHLKGHEEEGLQVVSLQHVNHLSDIKCDDAGMSCLITNLVVDAQGRFRVPMEGPRRDLLHLAGFFGHFGIGEPAAYFYIDAWTLAGREAFRCAAVRRGFKRVNAERQLFPATLFVPVFLDRTSEVTDSDVRVPLPALFVQVLWRDNFFRKLYVGAAALGTCQYWLGAASCTNVTFVQHLEEAADLFGHTTTTQCRGKVFDFAVLGVSKRLLLPEQDILMPDSRNLPLMTAGYKAFAGIISSRTACTGHPPKRLFVYRRGSTRRVLNHQEICRKLNLTPIIFEDYTLGEQVCLASRADLIVGAHGAAMAHAFFMDRRALLVELFPCNFIKTIYRNLALVLGVRYRWWQAGDPDSCPDLPAGQVDWSSLPSKDAFRNQNFHVDPSELESVVRFDPNKGVQYLAYMPFEQYNNQLISLRCACGMARLLNRTLVLPEMGYRAATTTAMQRQVYQPRDYRWQPLSRYFNVSTLQRRLPCQTVPYSAYYGQVRSVDRIYFRRLGARFNKQFQAESYFYFVAGLHYSHHRSLPYSIPVYNSASSVLKHFSDYSRSLQHLVLGNVFWMYTFDAPLEYPVRRYVDVYQEAPDWSYKSITAALGFADRLGRLSQSHPDPPPGLGTVHWRRGDYKEKCGDELLRHSCYPTLRNLTARIVDVDPMRSLTWRILSNTDTSAITKKLTQRGFKVHTAPCLLDPIECAILDQMAAIRATVFIGNMYSSFTRTIIDARNQRGLRSELL